MLLGLQHPFWLWQYELIKLSKLLFLLDWSSGCSLVSQATSQRCISGVIFVHFPTAAVAPSQSCSWQLHLCALASELCTRPPWHCAKHRTMIWAECAILLFKLSKLIENQSLWHKKTLFTHSHVKPPYFAQSSCRSCTCGSLPFGRMGWQCQSLQQPMGYPVAITTMKLADHSLVGRDDWKKE